MQNNIQTPCEFFVSSHEGKDDEEEHEGAEGKVGVAALGGGGLELV